MHGEGPLVAARRPPRAFASESEEVSPRAMHLAVSVTLALLVAGLTASTSHAAPCENCPTGPTARPTCRILPPPEGVHQTNLWPDGKVFFAFDENVTSENRDRAIAAMDEIQSVCGVVFELRLDEPNWIHIRDSFENSSQVGMTGGLQYLNLDAWEIHYTIVHEFMHALGFWHEQQRPDRDCFVRIEWDNIDPDLWDNFAIPGGEDTCLRTITPYDFDSIMHYSACAGSTCLFCDSDEPDCRSITVLEPHENWQDDIGQRDHLSDGDAQALAQLYPPAGPVSDLELPSAEWRADDAHEQQVFGRSVAVHVDRLIVGAPGFESLAFDDAASLLSTQDGSEFHWLVPPTLAEGARFGASVDLGTFHAIVGAPPYGASFLGDLGTVHVFDVFSGEHLRTLIADDLEYGKLFGHAVALDGSQVAVGSPLGVFDVLPLVDWGAAYVFDANSGEQLAKLLPADTQGEYTGFGHSLDIGSGRVIVGAPSDDHAGAGSGAAYVFDASTGQQLQKLVANDAQPIQGFGTAVLLHDGLALVGAPQDSSSGSHVGSVYVFDPGTGAQLMKIEPARPSPSMAFGRSLAASGDALLVGAPGTGPVASGGAALTFDLPSGEQTGRLQACRPRLGDGAGFSVALSPNGAFVGVPNRDLECPVALDCPADPCPEEIPAEVGSVLVFAAPSAAEITADLDGDGVVGVGDLLLLLGQWGGDGSGDLDGDGVVGTPDLLALLAAWTS